MAEKKITEALSEIVEILTTFESEDRKKIITAALTLLGETPIANSASRTGADAHGPSLSDFNGKARTWMKQNNLTSEDIEQAFHLNGSTAEVIMEPPGDNKKVKTLNAYLLTGAANLIASGEAKFADKEARDLCTKSGCYDATNHATILKDKGTDFTGSKSTGWTLTAPGLKRAATLVKSA
jgi:hypothetical protein